MIFSLRLALTTFHYTADIIHKDKRIERWKVVRLGHPSVTYILENNRPFIREVKKLKHHRLTWKTKEGLGTNNFTEIEMIKKRLEGH